MDTDDELMRRFLAGPPCDRWTAGNELARRGGLDVETRLSDFLLVTTDDGLMCDALAVLGRMRISQVSTIDAILMRASSAADSVRSAAVRCLLHSSPKLAPRLTRVRELAGRESVEQIREVFLRLLARYPE
jgi:hypothetical protein